MPLQPDLERLQSFLHHVGIDSDGNRLHILMELMSLCIQSLGAVRILATDIENSRKADLAARISNHGDLEDAELSHWALRKSFSFAAKRMLRHILTAESPHNLDPSRHVVESFPGSADIIRTDWLAAHWAVLGDPDRDYNESCYKHAGNNPSCSCPNVETETSTSSSSKIEQNEVTASDERPIVLNHLVSCAASAIMEKDIEGRTVLHIASRLPSTALFDCVLKHTKARDSGMLSLPNHNGALPLHNTARFSRSPAMLEKVAAAYPTALTTVNNDAMLPLHWAAAKNRSVDIIKRLLSVDPAHVRTPNAEGYLPLHCAGQNDSLEVVRTIYEAFPDAIRTKDLEGGLPLHHACCLNENAMVVKLLYEAFPEAILTAQHDGVTPLHLAASQNESPDVVRYILSVCPEAASVQDREGWCALRCLLSNAKGKWTARRLECLKLIAKANPRVTDVYSTSLEDTAARVILKYCGKDLDLARYQQLSWNARHGAIWLIGHMSRHPMISYSSSNNRNKHIARLLAAGYNDYDEVLRLADEKVKRDAVGMAALQMLVSQYMNPGSLLIPSGVLRKIVDFL
eukprot:gene34720-42045_t